MYAFTLTTTARNGAVARDHLQVVEASGFRAPRITKQPVSQTVAIGGFLTLAAAASADPVPSVVWQVSSDSGKAWRALGPPVRTSSYEGFVQVKPGTAGAFSGYEYRAVFTNSAGSTTTRAIMATTPVSETSDFDGYEAAAPAGQSFTTVTADWIVPTVTCPADFSTFTAQWPGISNFTGAFGAVVQDGTIEGCDGYQAAPDGAWYELLGDAAVNGGGQIELPTSTYPVEPGDHIAANVSIANSTWSLSLIDSTEHWTFAIGEPQPSPPLPQSAVEVISEGNADFGSVTFTNATATLAGRSEPLGSLFPLQVGVSSGSTPVEGTSPLEPNGDQFTDTYLPLITAMNRRR